MVSRQYEIVDVSEALHSMGMIYRTDRKQKAAQNKTIKIINQVNYQVHFLFHISKFGHFLYLFTCMRSNVYAVKQKNVGFIVENGNRKRYCRL